MLAELKQLKRETDSNSRVAEGGTGSSLISATNSSPSKGGIRGSGKSLPVARTRRIPKIIDSLAVLPFKNTNGDPEHEYLSDGITESLINIMATLPKLRVMAHSTVFEIQVPGN